MLCHIRKAMMNMKVVGMAYLFDKLYVSMQIVGTVLVVICNKSKNNYLK